MGPFGLAGISLRRWDSSTRSRGWTYYFRVPVFWNRLNLSIWSFHSIGTLGSRKNLKTHLLIWPFLRWLLNRWIWTTSDAGHARDTCKLIGSAVISYCIVHCINKHTCLFCLHGNQELVVVSDWHDVGPRCKRKYSPPSDANAGRSKVMHMSRY